MTGLTIHPIRAEDREDWDRLFEAYLAFYETTRPKAQYDIAFARLLSADAQEFHGLIAKLDGKAIGLTHYLFHRHMWNAEDSVYLQDLFVDPSARKAGAGRALIKAVHAHASDTGASTVYWLTQDFNETARKLYDSVADLTPFIKYNMPV